ncbi:putative periplasmic serine endoprotease DegP-like [Gammaproteobacteria bacterium]
MFQRLLSLLCALLLVLPTVGQPAADFTSQVEQASRAVVNISTVQRTSSHDKKRGIIPDLKDIPPELRDFLGRFFDHPRPAPRSDRPTQGLGSGFIISPDGYLLTAAHVVRDADEIVVRDADHHEWTAKVVGIDALIDIALLKVAATDLPTARIGNSDTLKVGQWVLAIGQPFGLDYTATAGIVSALGRNLPNDTYVPFIQTDVAVNPGNSGGPLYNLDGAVVGINSQIYTPSGGYAGLSFAIPIAVAMDAVEQIKTHGRVIRGWLGITIQQVTQDLARSFGLDRPQGALITQIAPQGPARSAGLQAGDIVVTYDERSIDGAGDLPPLVGRTHPGTKVPVVVIRNGRKQVVTVTVAELPRELAEPNPEKAKKGKAKTSEPPLLGLTVTDLPVGERLNNGPRGVMVKRVEEGPARTAGVLPHDIILRMGNITVRDVDHFRTLVPSLPKNHNLPILVLRENNPTFLALRIPDIRH